MKKRVLFIFNQLLSQDLSSGGDVKSYNIYMQAKKDEKYVVDVMAPEVALKNFSKELKYPVGATILERVIKPSFVPFIFIIYLIRSFESLKYINKAGFDTIYTTGDFFCNTFYAYVYKLFHKSSRWCACIYHINEAPQKRISNFFLRSLVSHIMQKISFILIKNNADVIFVLNKNVKKYLIRNNFNNKVIVSNAGLDVLKVKNTVSKFSLSKKKHNLVFFNRVNPTKGVFDLPHIVFTLKKDFPDIHLDIIGGVDAITKDKLLSAFKKLNCSDNITIHGFIIDKVEVYKIINSSQVFLQTSYEEGWSIVLFESILCGTLPVVYDLPIYREIFGDLLFTSSLGAKESFTAYVKTVLLLSDSSYNMKLSSLQAVAEKYDWQKVYNKERSFI